MVTSRTGTRPFHISGRNFFVCRNVGKNCHFAYGKPPVPPAARIRFLRLKNVQKCSLHEREPGLSYFGRKFFMCRNVVRKGHFAKFKLPFRWRPEYAFLDFEPTKNDHSANGNRLFRISGGNIFMYRNVVRNDHFASGYPAVSAEAEYAFSGYQSQK